MTRSKEKSNFWTTLSGTLTGLATLITAIGGIYAIYHSSQSSPDPPVPFEPAENRPESPPPETPLTPNPIPVNPTAISPTGVYVEQGDVVQILPAPDFEWSCKGSFEGNEYEWVGPDGKSNSQPDGRYTLPDAPFCSLIGRVGTGEWQYLGYNNTFTADRSGDLYLTANDVTPENCYSENTTDMRICYLDNKASATATVIVRIKEIRE